jgi:hypothetical protein
LGRLVVVNLRVQGTHEAQTLARDGADQLPLPAAVADRRSCRIDTAGQRLFRHNSTAPDRSDQIILADDTVAVLHQVDQKVEHLRLDVNSALCAPQFAPFKIDLTVAKTKGHSRFQSIRQWLKSAATRKMLVISLSSPGGDVKALSTAA